MIFVVWLALVILTTFYCYFCEQRLFPKQKLLDWGPLTANGGDKRGRKGFRALFFRNNRDRASSYADW